MRARSCSDGSNPWGSPPTVMIVSTSASPPQATCDTISAQMLVVTSTVGLSAPSLASRASDAKSSPPQADAASTDAARMAASPSSR